MNRGSLLRASMVVVVAAGFAAQTAIAQNRFGDTPQGTAGGRAPVQGQGSQGGQRQQGQQVQQGGAQGGQGGQGGADLARLEAHERQDHGVSPTPNLHRGPMHGGTPTSIPGAQLITTRGLVELVRAATGGQGGQGGQGGHNAARVLFFDVLGGPERLPGAYSAVPAHQAGSFDDPVQREFGNFLQQVTQGRPETVLVFYCASTQCWMSYNAALRAAKMGYRQVLWYRGGIEAWKAAGLPLQAAGAAQAGTGAPQR